MTSTLTVAAAEGRARSVSESRTISRSKDTFFIVPYEGVRREHRRNKELLSADPLVGAEEFNIKPI
jgi:hypothetical protein